MWKAETRRTYDRKGLRYPSDVTDAEWDLARPFVDIAHRGSGRQRRVDVREVLNAVFYILGTGCQWRALPKDLPPRSTVHDYFVRWQCDGTLGCLHHALYEQAREMVGKEASPTTAIVDSQSVKGAEKGGRPIDPVGYDAAKKVKGRKRHAVVDTLGLMLGCAILPGNVQDRDGCLGVLREVRRLFTLSGAGDCGWRLPGQRNSPGGAPGSAGQTGDREALRYRKGLCGAPEALDRAPPYNLARLGFEWSAVVARTDLVGAGRNTVASVWLRPQPPAGGTTGTDGGAHGPIDAISRQGGACLLREHEAQPTVLGRDLRPDRTNHAQSRRGQHQGRAGGRRPADKEG